MSGARSPVPRCARPEKARGVSFATPARGGLHLAYYDTQRFTGVDADPDAQVDVVYAFSGDGGQTWSRMRLTPQPPQ